ncbi:hypothetical protein [Corallococcus sp. Z5C101001]|uniref:hypothetical protein n=1 Tax=Corallococcus sp. Z5C101001 TaxID=2596829 RepID=UPI00117F403D|nr:hypothetical protein [Corallococcus sp. Z5C101001]TSC25796.1 hypothetical protein FOF48_22555 [Corallococcus sp. Z5C101001]
MQRFALSGLALLMACATPVRRAASPVVPGTQAFEPPRGAKAAAPVKPSPVYVFEGVEVFGSRKVPKEKLLEVIGMPAPGARFNLEQGAFTPHLTESGPRLLAAYTFAFCRDSMRDLGGDRAAWHRWVEQTCAANGARN